MIQNSLALFPNKSNLLMMLTSLYTSNNVYTAWK